MVATTPHCLAVRQVVSEPRSCGIVQRYQTGFLELGFTNQQTVGSNVGDQQMQRLRDSQTGCCQQADQRCIGFGPQRVERWKPLGGEDKALDLVAGIDVRDATHLPIAEVVCRWRFVPGVFYAEILSKETHGLVADMSLRD